MYRLSMLIAAGLMTVIGCAPSIKIASTFQDPSFSFGQIQKQSSIKVLVSDNVNLSAFKKSFQKEYQSNQQFADALNQQIADSIKARFGCSAGSDTDPAHVSLLVSGSFDQNSIDQAQQLFGSSNDSHFFVVTSVEVSNERTSSGPMMMASPGGGSTWVGGGNTETCIVTINSDLWDVKTKKKVLSYASIGEAKVTMMFFGTALKNAVSNSIKHSLRYVESGMTK
ncbi:MAG: hypothetical protein JW768_10140 [Chitinispirillaceae bacterium]|nr:hypothetical protein [Chitinispirillaceae bacterium]